MKLTFAEGFPGDVACGAIGAQAYNYERGEMPVEVGDVMGEALLRTTWRKRTETPVEGQEKPKVTYTDEPVFARVEELPVVEGEGQGEAERKRARRPEKESRACAERFELEIPDTPMIEN